jgi:hypothetical protein
MSVPPLVAQSFPSTAIVILRLFDLLALVSADWPWAVSANAASAITAADTMCESFMISPLEFLISYVRAGRLENAPE